MSSIMAAESTFVYTSERWCPESETSPGDLQAFMLLKIRRSEIEILMQQLVQVVFPLEVSVCFMSAELQLDVVQLPTLYGRGESERVKAPCGADLQSWSALGGVPGSPSVDYLLDRMFKISMWNS